ncbi:MAG TPA: DUF1223 domain-containing protein [Stellaceae bacterium]|nr:DUF1223 domain-containing protein [Stellaceae bacterium]
MIKCSCLLALVPAFLSLCVAAGPAGAAAPPIVVELFTSEGCSSCPPADALLARLATRPDVLALSFDVDYWNSLGWKDPFSSPAATARQRHYAELFGLATVYTPQMVVDGSWEVVGSDRQAVEHALDAARQRPAAVPVRLVLDHGAARIGLGAADRPVSAAVWLIGFDRRAQDRVSRGENAGRMLTHIDVVRGMTRIGDYTGAARAIASAIPWRTDRVAALLQAADGRILGAAVADGAQP